MERVMKALAGNEKEIGETKSELPGWKFADLVQRMILHNALLKNVKDLLIRQKARPFSFITPREALRARCYFVTTR